MAGLLLMLVVAEPGFPRIANLWGCSPASTDYDQWARYSLLVTAGGTPDQARRFAAEVHRRNPDCRILGTAPLMNLGVFGGSPGESLPWMHDDWFLRRPDGSPVVWWAGQIYTPNILLEPCLDALVEQTAKSYGALLDEGVLAGVFYDSVVGYATWLGEVDTDGDGAADEPQTVNPRWHEAQCTFFAKLRERWPQLLCLANDVDFGHASAVNGRLFEGGPLLDRVANGALSAGDAVQTLQRWLSEARQPPLTFALMTHPLGWQGWRVGQGREVTTPGEVDRVARDFHRMRLGLLTTLMGDAWYAYDVGTVWYGSPWWYAEYDAPLGAARGPAREIHEVPPTVIVDWHAGEPADALAALDGMASDPAGITVGADDPTSPWRLVLATEPQRVPLQPGHVYRVRADLTVLAQPSRVIQFCVRTARGGWAHHDKAVLQRAAEPSTSWSLDATFVPDNFDDYELQWHLQGAGRVRLERLLLEEVNQSYFRRDFAGGAAFLNPLPRPLSLTLTEPLRRLRDDACPRDVIELDDDEATFEGGWEVVRGDGHWAGASFRRALKPGAVARWRVTAPSTDRYTLFACVPESADATSAAAWSLGGTRAVADQRRGDGGWREVMTVELSAGDELELSLVSGGAGSTLADAVRLESAARRHDGSRVERLELAPLDGEILLRDDG